MKAGLEDVLVRIKINFISMDRTILAMRGEVGDMDINLTWGEVADIYEGYQNTLDLLREEGKNLFEELNTIMEVEEGEEAQEI